MGMSRMARWGAAVLVTVAAFGVATWASGALLSVVMKSEADRWVVAAGLGVAVAALAALWGHSWAARDRVASSGGAGRPGGPAAGVGGGAQGERSVAAGGDITGIASTGDDATNTQQR
jgi:hypothetical protein